MTVHDVAVALVFDDEPDGEAALAYAMSLVHAKNSRLSSLMCVPLLDIPGAHLLPLVNAVVDEVNERRHDRAEAMARMIDDTARIQAFDLQVRIFQDNQPALTAAVAAAARLCDFCVVPQPVGELSLTKLFVETILFGSGRPIIMVPEGHREPASFGRIVVAWDGGARAARAVGDAMPFLLEANQVDVVCVKGEPGKARSGADLAAHLSARCKRVELVEPTPDQGDVGKAIRDHALYVRADLVVMGAFAHARFLQVLLGGTTNDMILCAARPVLMSY